MTPTVVLQPPLRAATVRHIGRYQEIGTAFARLAKVAEPAGLLRPGAPLVAVFHDNPATTPQAGLRSDAGVIIDSDTPLPPDLTESLLLPGQYLHGTHRGPYEGLRGTYGLLLKEMADRGLARRSGPAYELYPNNTDTAAPPDLITEIYIPVR